MSSSTDHAARSHARTLAEAVILQSIEDLWNPVCKRGSLVFFQGYGFILCSEIAGISYVKQLVILRMLADAGPKKDWTAGTLVTTKLFCGNMPEEKGD